MNVIYRINRIKKQNHTIVSTDAKKKALDKMLTCLFLRRAEQDP